MAKKKTDPADEKTFSANDLSRMTEVFAKVGMRAVLELAAEGVDAVIITKRVDEDGSVVYGVDPGTAYRLVKEA